MTAATETETEAMDLFVVRCPSGHDWLVEAASAEDALANWPGPDEAEEAIAVEEPTIEDVLVAHETGESDVDTYTTRDWVLSRTDWVPVEGEKSTYDLVAWGGVVLARAALVNGELDFAASGCGVRDCFQSLATAQDICDERLPPDESES